ncbi:Hypothetical predicted protein [Cloeon dipterum]|uniref:Uncharacterized protein n=1 Tax=Cloeon dipterum TaxID=197152 RepID=A0A8S1DLU4_9INSE|nr:Hypothetical predicted protein [Cloeon dipterum]
MKRRQRRAREFYFRSEKDRLPTTNGASPLDNMRSLEHYLNDLMRSQGTSNGEPPELKGKRSDLNVIYAITLRRTELVSVAFCTI